MKRFTQAIDVRTDRAVARYERALASKGAELRRDGQVRTQVANYHSYQEHMFPIDFRVRELVAESRAPQVHLFSYLRFARRLDRVVRTEAGDARLGMALYEVERGFIQGLARELLLTICREVFDIDPARYHLRDREGVSAEVSRPSEGVGPAPDSGSDQSQAARD